jgi:hypothetical protein
MKTNELQGIYAATCEAKGEVPNEGQFKTWKDTLSWCERADLEQALAWYFAENAKFPMPAELKALAGKAMRERIAKSSEKKYLVCFQCPLCGATVSHYFTLAEFRIPICNSPYRCDEQGKRVSRPAQDYCPSDLQITFDERPAA